MQKLSFHLSTFPVFPLSNTSARLLSAAEYGTLAAIQPPFFFIIGSLTPPILMNYNLSALSFVPFAPFSLALSIKYRTFAPTKGMFFHPLAL